MLVAVTVAGLPIESVVLFLLPWLFVVLAYVLYRIDVARGDGEVTVFGWGGEH